MGFCWRRVLLVLLVFFVFFTSTFAFRSASVREFLFNRSSPSHQVDVTEGMILERLALSSSEIIAQLSKLSPQQQKKLIERVYRDVVVAAEANGQSHEQAQKLGGTVVAFLLKAVSRPSIADSYF
ncbi:hypothetical protein [Bartonella machadoae]|uniref:hypothetical protein n=1 Tax=Bartonella machadoae TaxID=2893471 RepID=UPI001F4D0A7F|nr:hypothetical protein [Bartonella machadoae]UNE55566.1 hypothetical protein LNM86_08590 [Bartonella machadoae]